MKYKPPRERERGRRKAEPQTQGPWAPACTLQPSPSELGPPRVLPGWVPVGEERAELGLGLQAGEQSSPPTELPYPPALPLSPSFPPSASLSTSLTRFSSFLHFSFPSKLFFFPPFPPSLHPPSFFLYPLPFTSPSPPTVLPSPASLHPKSPGSRSGP